ncbi:hypothetical protein [Thiomicrorhabdus cannonii]|uniref:hypothetical protein n=1 Tax=Thiomicrorhabdus cannonii TaxID=2748011 RepID=UPI0015BBE935|nr:hypothetical protein [Thiomicrorhabdus cannonii]
MRQFVYISFLSLLGLGATYSLPASADLPEINQLEQRLFNEGESAALYLALAKAYAQSGDLASAQAYLQIIEQTWSLETLNEQLRVQIEEFRQSLKTHQNKMVNQQKLLVVMESGYESNANRGTNLDFLTFSLDNGEAFYLSLDEGSQQRESFFVSTTLLHHYLPDNQDWMLSTALETTQYSHTDLESSLLIRSSLRWRTQSITLYHYANSRKLNGILYSGHFLPFDWGLRRQNDRQIANLGISDWWQKGNSIHHFGVSLGLDEPLETRAGGITESVRFKYELTQQELSLTYQFEYGHDQEAYNPFFYQHQRDTYQWHSLGIEYTLSQSAQHRWAVKLQYDDKNHKINLNSWQNTTVAISWAQLF